MKLLWLLLIVPVVSNAQNIQHYTDHRSVSDRIVVLTFDDAVSSDYHFIAPILKKYHFGATFFVCEFPPDFKDSTKYMTWNQIKELNNMGFEIGNHTWHHIHVNKMDSIQFAQEMGYIENQCMAYGIPKPVSFAYPGYDTSNKVIPWLKERGYIFARAGGNKPYDPQMDNPYVIPSFSTSGNDTAKVFQAIHEAENGKIVVLTIHGVPDIAHPWVTTPPALFEKYMQYLYDNHYHVIAMRDLKQWIKN